MGTQSEEWMRAAHMLRCSGFGATGSDIDVAASFGGPTGAIDRMLDGDPSDDLGVAATPMPVFEPPTQPSARDSDEATNRYKLELAQQMDELTRWWLRRMVAVQQPTREKLTLLWHNHFATSAIKVQKATLMAAQNAKIRDLCLGDFDSLAYAMLTDAATITWLDGQSNRAKSPNENLSREFLELFGLGHGNGYSEADVREGARALTGWGIRKDGEAVFNEERFDSASKTILGTSGLLDAGHFCKIVLGHKNSPRYIASRFWQQLASDFQPSEATLDRLATAYGQNHDLRALTHAVFDDPEFTERRGTLMVRPVDWLIGLLRTLGVSLDTDDEMSKCTRTLKFLGQLPFYPPNVSGWPHGRAWLSTASVGFRLQAARRLVPQGDISVVTDAATIDRVDAVGYLIGVGSWSDGTYAVLKPLTANPVSLVAGAVNSPEYMVV